jgi:ABC-type multidrug transport system fused ATPase/permease subunit
LVAPRATGGDNGSVESAGGTETEQHVVEVRQPERAPRQVTISARVEVGRECDGIVVDDARVSRRHLALEPGPSTLTVVDLGSTNGTLVNDALISESAELEVGDRIRLGDVEIAVVSGPAALAAPPRLHDLQARPGDGAVIRFRAGTPGERAAQGMASAVRKARSRLAGLGPDLNAITPQICLVDPFRDPSTGDVVTEGSVVDVVRREIWMAVTAESPPEPPERPLALVLGSALPAGAELNLLVEGYGLVVSGAASPDAELAGMNLPALAHAEGELRTAMVQSFVAFLIGRASREQFLEVLNTAEPGGVELTVQRVYGRGLAALEDSWARSLEGERPKVKLRGFLALTVRYLRPYRRRELEIFVYMLFSLAFTTVFPFGVRAIFDDGIGHHDFGKIQQILGILAVALVVSMLAGLRRAYLAAYVSSSVTRDLRVEMFTRLQSLSAGWFSGQQEGDVMSRLFSDVGQLESALSGTIRDGVFQLLTVLVSAAVLLSLSPLLAIIVIVGAPVVGIVYRVMSSGARKRSLAVQEELGSTYTIATENYGAQAVVKAFGLEDKEGDRFTRGSQRLFGREIKLQLFAGLFGLSINAIVAVLQISVLGLGAWLVVHGHLQLGSLVAFTTAMGQVISPVTGLTGIGQQIQSSMGSLLRINEVIDATPEIADAPAASELPPLAREVRLDNVSFSYTPQRTTLEGVNCVIPAGTRVAFVGPTGAGKSSVLHLIMRFYDVGDGALLFDGHDAREVTVASLRGQIGVVFQDTFLFDTTIGENIAMGKPGASEAEIEAAARAAELHEFVEALPRGYNTLVGERGGRLSGGQRQRLAIARALLRNPRILVLDEATSALDPRTERLISDTLETVGEGRTTIAVTHRLPSIMNYDQIFVMSAGHLVERGTHTELLAFNGIYAELWTEQTGGIATTEAPFDAVGALSAVTIFSGLARDELTAAASRLRAVELPAGARLAQNSGMLAIVRKGRPRVFEPGLNGQLLPAATLQPGDAFGLSALLGAETGAELVAEEPVELLVLDSDSLAALAAIHPSVSAALMGEGDGRAGPQGGELLSRASMIMRASLVGAGGLPAPEPVRAEIARMSGVFPVAPS